MEEECEGRTTMMRRSRHMEQIRLLSPTSSIAVKTISIPSRSPSPSNLRSLYSCTNPSSSSRHLTSGHNPSRGQMSVTFAPDSRR